MSLTALGNVIQALSEGAKFIPYRNHVLTKLMKDSLGGTAKTLMFVNCSPSVYNESEMKNSLDYASRVKKIKNSVAKNTETKETLKLKKCISDFEIQMDQMKELLMNSDQGDAWKALEAKFIEQYEGQGHHWIKNIRHTHIEQERHLSIVTRKGQINANLFISKV